MATQLHSFRPSYCETLVSLSTYYCTQVIMYDCDTSKKILLTKTFLSVAYDHVILNDIILLKLSRPVTLSDYVNTICLEPNHTIPDRSSCLTTGWGLVDVGNDRFHSLSHS